ncbi:MAG TPA: hypothetical protein VF173_04955 [Thermoanaerobaculia bacterium]|nr:hypothetical protein [Thermoanaerobaculia bacterium]
MSQSGKRGAKTFLGKLNYYLSICSAIGLMGVSVIALYYEGTGRFAPKEKNAPRPSTDEALVFLVAIICGGMGSERLLILRKLDSNVETASEERRIILARLNKINRALGIDFKMVAGKENALIAALAKVNKAEILIGLDEIEEGAQKLLLACDKNDIIRATAQYFPALDQEHKDLSADYPSFVAKTVKKAIAERGAMEYHVIVASDTDKNAQDRKDAFAAEGVSKKLFLKIRKQQWPFEVLIGGHSMNIAIPRIVNEKNYAVAIRVTDEEFVARAIEWYDDVLWKDSSDPEVGTQV